MRKTRDYTSLALVLGIPMILLWLFISAKVIAGLPSFDEPRQSAVADSWEDYQVSAPTPPAPLPPPPPPPAPAGPATSFGEGTYVVSVDIEPGTYRTAGPDPNSSFDLCWWYRLSDTSGDLDAIKASNMGPGPATVTISPDDAAFRTSNCQPWQKVD